MAQEPFAKDRFGGLEELSTEPGKFFRLGKFGKRDLFVTPEGYGYLVLGINHIASVGFGNFREEPFTTKYDRNWDRFWKEHLGPQLRDSLAFERKA
ncbi:MAG: hypothetical protein AAGH89_05595, partial [Verrucomicrobiota bacterium]